MKTIIKIYLKTVAHSIIALSILLIALLPTLILQYFFQNILVVFLSVVFLSAPICYLFAYVIVLLCEKYEKIYKFLFN